MQPEPTPKPTVGLPSALAPRKISWKKEPRPSEPKRHIFPGNGEAVTSARKVTRHIRKSTDPAEATHLLKEHFSLHPIGQSPEATTKILLLFATRRVTRLSFRQQVLKSAVTDQMDRLYLYTRMIHNGIAEPVSSIRLRKTGHTMFVAEHKAMAA